MTNRHALSEMLGHDVVVTNPHLDAVMASEDGRQISLPQTFRVEPDVTADARRVIAELEKYEEEHGHHDDGWPCLNAALEAARDAVTS